MNSKRPLRAARSAVLAIVLLTLQSAPVLAADKELLDVLLANGAITQPQYEELLKKEELSKDDVDQVVVSLNKNGFRMKSADGNFEMKIGARLHAQASGHDGDVPTGDEANDGVELRRARLELSGRFYHDWIWAAEADFADNRVGVKDFWLGYRPWSGVSVYTGHQKQPYSLSLEMSSNDIPFIERGIDNDLNVPFVDRAIGLRTDLSGKQWFLAAGVFGDSVDPNSDDDEGVGVAARLVAAPILDESHVLHLGVRGAYREPSDSSDSARIKDETTHMSNLNVVDTGAIADVDSTTLVGGEVAAAYGPVSLYGEYSQALIDRDTGDDLAFSSWHAAAALSLTGETMAAAYRIDAGEFKRLTPADDFSFAGRTWGAWELAARIASLDVNDEEIVGGEEKVLTSALNWYVNPSIRFMAEWSQILDTDGSNQLRRDAQGMEIFQMRSQFTF